MSDLFTLDELRGMFGDSMPIEAVQLLQNKSLGIDEVRRRLQGMAKTPKALAPRALNIYAHHVADAIDNDRFDEFSTQELAMEKVVEFVIRECCPRN